MAVGYKILSAFRVVLKGKSMDNLPELRDIHLPNGVSVFPPAYGWWVILFGLLALVLLYKLFVFFRQKSKKLYALKLINRIGAANAVEAALEMSEVLRRICVFKYPTAAALFGQEWLKFLNEKCKYKLDGKAAELLLNAPYISTQSYQYSLEEVTKLREFCKQWIGENL